MNLDKELDKQNFVTNYLNELIDISNSIRSAYRNRKKIINEEKCNEIEQLNELINMYPYEAISKMSSQNYYILNDIAERNNQEILHHEETNYVIEEIKEQNGDIPEGLIRSLNRNEMKNVSIELLINAYKEDISKIKKITNILFKDGSEKSYCMQKLEILKRNFYIDSSFIRGNLIFDASIGGQFFEEERKDDINNKETYKFLSLFMPIYSEVLRKRNFIERVLEKCQNEKRQLESSIYELNDDSELFKYDPECLSNEYYEKKVDVVNKGDFNFIRDFDKNIKLGAIRNITTGLLAKEAANNVHGIYEYLNDFFEELTKDKGLINYENIDGIRLIDFPLVLNIEEGLSLAFNTNSDEKNTLDCIDIINNIIFNVTSHFPVGYVNNTLIDTKYSGGKFTEYIYLKDINEKLMGKEILTDEKSISNELETTAQEIVKIIQEKLQNKYTNIYEYNQDNQDMKIPIKLMTIVGFPKGFNNRMIDNLNTIILNGPKCGINVILQNDTDYEISTSDKNKISKIINSMNSFYIDKSCYIVKDRECIVFDRVEFNQEKNEILKTIAQKMKEQDNLSLNLNMLINKENKNNAAESLCIPIGKNEKGEIQNLILGKGTSHHGLIAGQTGSGKSTLLHTIITSAINMYTPDELNIYLMDFKEGIEFKAYSKFKIPHIKLIALESQVEFGESILEFMTKELKSRGELFKKLEVENLKGYKNKTGKDMPRILLIIDEFTNLFNRNNGRQSTNNNAQLMKRIINQGRAFGINVLMASQTIKDTLDSTLSSDVIEQMAVRIGLKSSPKDAEALMGPDNREIHNIGSEIGMAIYNAENGRGKNSRFRVGYLSSEERDESLMKIANLYNSDKYKDSVCKVFDGNGSIDIEKDDRHVLNNNKVLHQQDEYIYLGEPIKIGQPISIRFSNGMNNLLAISNNVEHLDRMVTFSVVSILHQVKNKSVKFKNKKIYMMDCIENIYNDNSVMSYLIDNNKEVIETSQSNTERKIISDLYDILQERRNSGKVQFENLYLIINGIHRCREILINNKNKKSVTNITEVKSSGSSSGFSIFNSGSSFTSVNSQEETNSTNNFDNNSMLEKNADVSSKDKLEQLIKEGGDYNIFVIATSDTLKNINKLNDKLGYKIQDYMNWRIAFNMNNNDGNRFINVFDVTESLNENTAILYDEITGDTNKFIIYSHPDIKWINEKI